MRFESNCPVCKHTSTMPPRSPDEISMQMMLAYKPQLRPMAVMKFFLQKKIGSGVTVMIRTVLEMSQELGAGGVLSWQRRRVMSRMR